MLSNARMILVATLVAIGGCGVDPSDPAGASVESPGGLGPVSGLVDANGIDRSDAFPQESTDAPVPVVALTPIAPLPGDDAGSRLPLTDSALFPLLGFDLLDDLLLSFSDNLILELLTPTGPQLNTSQTFLERLCLDNGNSRTFCRQRFSR